MDGTQRLYFYAMLIGGGLLLLLIFAGEACDKRRVECRQAAYTACVESKGTECLLAASRVCGG